MHGPGRRHSRPSLRSGTSGVTDLELWMRQGQAVVDHTADVIHCSSFCFGAAPTWREDMLPFLKIISVGIDWKPYFAAVCGFSSTLSLTILTFSPSEPAISSSAGAIIRHGPHHSAQKST